MIMEAWQVQNLMSRPAGWKPREELQFLSKGSGLAEFFPARLGGGSQSLFC